MKNVGAEPSSPFHPFVQTGGNKIPSLWSVNTGERGAFLFLRWKPRKGNAPGGTGSEGGRSTLAPLLLRRIGQPLHEPIPLVGVYLAADDLVLVEQ